ncbi:DUF72 domain-containing protein [Arthrobacter bambusae]|uniref:Uncharacterized protein YecE (DUF72 family) n=1 Tax=Arthrobacter bambusae TaxID=1338426 RepID=A0AAW8DE27_9MICC|nr:DUF72 domain-containing protein [Arthrobacter bambusae]MDP9904137.1 uncharacterized protein YecE (DUF72 family) [Arthrobacter bambusae]MDQ0127867.1 uncharacterized protein YecE (DUF72 family) [Arthrobacter bambusae]MDQ0179209.1 uncharacterized protein YecE (DUF72 family) [Arthrobacter bambusae]MDQ0240678.1 uncharacterized protein YecE (DUF72 family) [Arthrobacter bambusae]
MATHVGTSGWSYDHWDHVLYPAGTPSRNRLDCYVQQFETVELNASFYRWPRDSSFASWRRRLPEGFVFSVKAPRGLTHGKRLYSPEAWIGRITSAWHELGDRRGVLLVQLPPGMERDDGRLAYFLGLLPEWIKVAVEFRHDSWHDEAVYELLEKHRTAYCIMSGAELPCVLRATAPFVYIRMHGPDHHHLYGGSYSDQDLRWWTDRIAEWETAGKEVFVYFNNDGGGNAVRNARTLRSFLGNH